MQKNDKLRPRTYHKGTEEEYRYSSTLSLTLAPDDQSLAFHAAHRPLYPWVVPGTRCIGGSKGPMAGQYGCRKIRSHRNPIPVPSMT